MSGDVLSSVLSLIEMFEKKLDEVLSKSEDFKRRFMDDLEIELANVREKVLREVRNEVEKILREVEEEAGKQAEEIFKKAESEIKTIEQRFNERFDEIVEKVLNKVLEGR
ncbi:MAG: hypothetical protein QW655_04175 [Nitrososphaerota archaeon]